VIIHESCVVHGIALVRIDRGFVRVPRGHHLGGLLMGKLEELRS